MKKEYCDKCGAFGAVIKIKPYRDIPDSASIPNLEEVREITHDYCHPCYAGDKKDETVGGVAG